MSNPTINIADVELQPRPAAERYDARTGMIAPRLGARKLGYNLTAVPPGKRAFPFHSHHANEEMAYIIEGTGEVRIGEARYPIRPGDIITFPPGGPETAHQIINTGAAELKYLAVSTRIYPEVAEYPTTGKFGVLSELPPGPDGMPRSFRAVARAGQDLDYWEGE